MRQGRAGGPPGGARRSAGSAETDGTAVSPHTRACLDESARRHSRVPMSSSRACFAPRFHPGMRPHPGSDGGARGVGGLRRDLHDAGGPVDTPASAIIVAPPCHHVRLSREANQVARATQSLARPRCLLSRGSRSLRRVRRPRRGGQLGLDTSNPRGARPRQVFRRLQVVVRMDAHAPVRRIVGPTWIHS